MSELINRRMLLLSGGAALLLSSTGLAQNLPIMTTGARNFAGRIRISLQGGRIDGRTFRGDPTGNSPIPGAAGSFATPRRVWRSYHRLHPDLGFNTPNPTPEQLLWMAAWIESHERQRLQRAGRYINSRVVRGQEEIDVTHEMELPAGTYVWVDRNSGRVVMKDNCANALKAIADCYVVQFNYSEQQLVKWFRTTDGTFSVTSTHVSLTTEEMRRLYADDCFYVEDELGRRKPEPNCPLLYCPPGSRWPVAELVLAVGLPVQRPPSTFHFALKNGRGTLSLPRWAVERFTAFIPCVATDPYHPVVPGFEGWTMYARFDKVEQTEFRATLSAGRLNRVLRGSSRY
jgi:hypothetical protein